jgi:hypothetical protein
MRRKHSSERRAIGLATKLGKWKKEELKNRNSLGR